MVRVVCVHGMANQNAGEATLLKDWLPALNDGLTRAGATGLDTGEVAMAFYGNIFRPPGQTLTVSDPPYGPQDVTEQFEQQLLTEWWAEAARLDPAITGPDAEGTLVRVPRAVQTGLFQLMRSRFFAGVVQRALIFDLKQVHRYLFDPDTRHQIRSIIANTIGPDTRVVVAHSLGSVAAYETLCDTPDHAVRAFVTIGSPLGIPNLIFDRLEPAPIKGTGYWPGRPDLVWTNIADAGDLVALQKDLRPRFGDRVHNMLVHNGIRAHSSTPYLTDQTTGRAVADGLG